MSIRARVAHLPRISRRRVNEWQRCNARRPTLAVDVGWRGRRCAGVGAGACSPTRRRA
jgi:hypothetical protein